MKVRSKKVVSYLLIGIIGIFCYFGEINAQNSKRFNLDTKAKTYSLEKNQEVIVFVNNVGKYDVVSVEGQSTNSKAIEVKGWEIAYSSSASLRDVGASEIEAINSFPEELISFNKTTLLVNNQTEANKRKAIHILLPAGTRAKVHVNGELMQSGTVSISNALMIQGSRAIASSKGYSPRSTILQAISREVSKDENSLRQVDAQSLRKLATKVVNAPKIDDKSEKWAMVQVVVNEEGKVGSSFYAGGDKLLAGVGSEALKQFSFKPFVVNDKPTIVISLVGMSSSNGQIKLFAEIAGLKEQK